jgi:hypothetical protein
MAIAASATILRAVTSSSLKSLDDVVTVPPTHSYELLVHVPGARLANGSYVAGFERTIMVSIGEAKAMGFKITGGRAKAQVVSGYWHAGSQSFGL